MKLGKLGFVGLILVCLSALTKSAPVDAQVCSLERTSNLSNGTYNLGPVEITNRSEYSFTIVKDECYLQVFHDNREVNSNIADMVIRKQGSDLSIVRATPIQNESKTQQVERFTHDGKSLWGVTEEGDRVLIEHEGVFGK